MAVQLNHLIVMARDQTESARFFTDMLGLPEATRFGPFLVVQTANGVSLDFDEAAGDVAPLHYAFLVTESEFDEIFGRIRERGVDLLPGSGRASHGDYGFSSGPSSVKPFQRPLRSGSRLRRNAKYSAEPETFSSYFQQAA